MLLYLSGPAPNITDKTLFDAHGTPIYHFKTRCLWKSESTPSVPEFRQTEIVDAMNNKVIAHIDWDGVKPVYVDFGSGDERLVSDMVLPKAVMPGRLLFETPVDLRWELTPKSMILGSGIQSSPLARFYPNSRLTPEGKIETISAGTLAKNKAAKDWFEINMLEYEDLPIAELLVDFIVLESVRRVFFIVEDGTPPPPVVPPESLKGRLRQAVF